MEFELKITLFTDPGQMGFYAMAVSNGQRVLLLSLYAHASVLRKGTYET